MVSNKDLVQINRFGYNRKNKNDELPSEWLQIDVSTDATTLFYEKDSGFSASCYINTNTKDIVICIRGTEVFTVDLLNSYFILRESDFTQADDVSTFITYLNTYILPKYSDYNITITGHSLGGALATLAALYLPNANVITYNSLGIAYLLTDEQYLAIKDRVTNYVVMNDLYAMNNLTYLVGDVKFIEPNVMIEYDDIPLELYPHNGLIFDDENNFEEYLFDMQGLSWNDKMGVAIWWYDVNKKNSIYSIPIDEPDIKYLKDAIDIFIKYDNLKNTFEYENKEENLNYKIGGTIDTTIKAIDDSKNYVIIGLQGDDYIYGGNNNDILIGDASSLSIDEIDDFNYYNALNLNDNYFEGTQDGNDKIWGGYGSDIIFGCGGNDYLYGEYGNDVIYGGSGDDFLYGGADDDYLYGGENKDHLNGGEGNDVLLGGDGDDILEGGEGDYEDILIGGRGKDTLVVAYGTNELYGGTENDTYKAYGGTNYMEDESGYDVYNLTYQGTYTINDKDRTGQIQLLNNVVYGSPNNEPVSDGYWYENGISYRWSGDGTTLYINDNIQVLNFYNGDYGIYLKPDIDEEKADDADNEMSEPIVFDLNGDGVQTTTLNNGMFFDVNGDGFAEKLAWADINDGVLVIDANGNGVIDGESEIVTALTLASYDSNSDGVINADDINYGDLKIMQLGGDLLSLEEAGIASINTAVTETDVTDDNGNYKFGEGTYTRTDGSTADFAEYYLVTDYKNTIAQDILEETETVSSLPDMDGSGTLYSLHQAMLRDDDLVSLVQELVNETDDTTRHELIEQIIYKWVGCEDIDTTSRGDYVNAQHLAVWEALNGKSFESTNEGEENPSNPNEEAADIIETVYETFKVQVYAELMKQSKLSYYYSLITITEDGKYDLSAVVSALEDAIDLNETSGKEKVVQVAEMLIGLDIIDYSNFFDPYDDNCFYTKFTADDRELKWQIDKIGKILTEPNRIGSDDYGDSAANAMRDEDETVIHTYHAFDGDDALYGGIADDYFAGCNGNDIVDGGDGDDHLLGNGQNDWIFGGAGNDMILGGDGNDIIFGGEGDDLIYPDIEGEDEGWVVGWGNDTVRGGTGNDTIIDYQGDEVYIFKLGDGQDTITDSYGLDMIYFGEGISWSDLTFERDDNNMIIKINDTTDQITIVNWFVESDTYNYEENYKIEMFKFSDGSIYYKDDISIETGEEKFQYIGSDEDEWFGTASNYKNYVYAQGGNDYIQAGDNSDDTYIYNVGDGYDYILDTSGEDTIIFGDGITTGNLQFRKYEGTMDINFDGIEGGITIQNSSNMIENYVLSDGTVITDITPYLISDVSYTSYVMGDYLNELRLLGDASKTVTGNANSNYIEGGEGDNTIEALGGDDEIRCEKNSNDIYIYNLGDGNDNITDIGGSDYIQFGDGITTENIKLTQSENNLVISFEDNEGQIVVNDYYSSDDYKIEGFIFADGTTLTDIESYLTDDNQDDDDDGPDEDEYQDEDEPTLPTVNNTYTYNVGDGEITIYDEEGTDTLVFGNGITTDNIKFAHQSNNYLNLVITFTDNDGSITIQDYFTSDDYKIENFTFSDGTTLTDISSYLSGGSAGEVDPVDPGDYDDEPEPDEPIDEEVPTLGTSDDEYDVNYLIQEINSYGIDSDVVLSNIETQNNEELLLAMVS